MLFRLGLTMMLVALVIAAGVGVAVTFSDDEPVAVASREPQRVAEAPLLERSNPPQPRRERQERNLAESSPEEPNPWEQDPWEQSTEEQSTEEQSLAEPSSDEQNREEQNREEQNREEQNREEQNLGGPGPKVQNREEQSLAEPSPEEQNSDEQSPGEPEVLPVADSDWPRPSSGEVADADGPRYYQPRQNSVLTLTVEALGLYDVPVADSDSDAALDRGVIHIPQTPMPWEEREQKNVYLAGHRLGYPNTGSRLIFYNLDKLKGGDTISLKDRSGRVYRYRVTEMFEVNPSDDWVMDTVLDRDIVTLQTCTPVPTFEKRLVVRADRIKASVSLG